MDNEEYEDEGREIIPAVGEERFSRSEKIAHMESSAEKWRNIIAQIKLPKEERNFHGTFERTFWQRCGFCIVFTDCDNCPLSQYYEIDDKEFASIRMCEGAWHNRSAAKLALKYADSFMLRDTALFLANKVLETIEECIKQERSKHEE